MESVTYKGTKQFLRQNIDQKNVKLGIKIEINLRTCIGAQEQRAMT